LVGDYSEQALNTKSKSTVLAICNGLLVAFPEYKNRVVAVSEVEVKEDNIPSEPIIFVATTNVVFTGGGVRSNSEMFATERLIVEFWDKTAQVKNRHGKDTPFWAFYDYDDILVRMGIFSNEFRSPRGNRVSLQQMDIDSSKAALMLAFSLEHTFKVCRDPEEGTEMVIGGRACPEDERPCKEEDNAKDQC
jgi:hypothetical protein